MATEKTEIQEKKDEPKAEYVSDQLAMKMWSVETRFLHEGAGIVTLRKTWDVRIKEFLLFPSFTGQDPDALKPDVWMAWRHVLKAPLGGHTYIRDYAEVLDAIPLQSPGAVRYLDSEQALTLREAQRRFEAGAPGLVALMLRVSHLPRSYKFYDVAAKEGEGEFVPLPFDVALENLTPAVPEAELERRRQRILSSLGRV